ncbi:MAG TPA: DUF1080 domain-containing protein [Pirellulaceae bacterium]|nr:DUF1080 domain-containing protein [Pirellulaceae bacterium]
MRISTAVFFLLFLLSSIAWAQPKAAVTDPALADADFFLQGEYVGWVSGTSVGLHVVALGKGQFEATGYLGGLPGEGWDKLGRNAYRGTADDGALILEGPAGRFIVAGGFATPIDTSGQTLGRLRKVIRISPTLGLQPPSSATVLFDGSSPEHLQGAKITDDGLLQAGVLTKMPVGPFRLHLEFRTPYMPQAKGQARGNSGVYIQQRYEVQILDSFGLEGVENECGGLYKQQRPDVNMCLPPLSWQTYDIWFTPPRFDEAGKKTANARLTVLLNGYLIHHHREITAKTGGGKPEGPQDLPINLQDHGNPVTFRNIWIVPGDGDENYSLSRYLTRNLRNWN